MSQGIKFYNDAETCVDDSLSGFVSLYPGLKFFPTCRFITKANNHISTNVGILSGGGSGHEPFCSGYVGNGMLAGVVAGNVFASPPKSHILQAIMHLHKFYKGGVLVIIPNYTGDRLNFGMAVEHARNINVKVESFIVGEDFASGQGSIAGKRGMCGLLYAYKIGGAMASRGKSMDEIIAMLNEIHKNMSTLGISAKSCSLPGQGPLFQMENDEMELGTGVHGEAGIEKIKISSAKEAVKVILNKLFVQLGLNESPANIVVFVNNLGTTTELEQNIICNEIFKQSSKTGIFIKRAYSGMLMTSLDMNGFQISILKLSDKYENEWIDLLDEMTEAPRWTGNKMSIFELSKSENFSEIELYQTWESKYILSSSQKILMVKLLELVADSIIKNEGKLNELDSGCGDGDCGTTLKHLALGIQQLLLTENFKCPADLLNRLSRIAEEKMGGTSGAIYSLFFSSAGKYFTKADENSLPIVWANALKIGLKTVIKYGQAQQGDRTIIDALQPAIDTFYKTIVSEKQNIKNAIEQSKTAAEIGCMKTKSMKARAGRASYVSEERLKDVDAGAYGFLICIKAISDCF